MATMQYMYIHLQTGKRSTTYFAAVVSISCPFSIYDLCNVVSDILTPRITHIHLGGVLRKATIDLTAESLQL
jgi:hypothetical protein